MPPIASRAARIRFSSERREKCTVQLFDGSVELIFKNDRSWNFSKAAFPCEGSKSENDKL